MDEATVELILALQIEDLEEITSNRKGKAVEGAELADADIAVDLAKSDLQSRKTLFADYRMARSISTAVQDDRALITVFSAEEQRAAEDREMACRMSGQPHRPMAKFPDCRVDDDVLSRFGLLNIRFQDDDDEVESLYGGSITSTQDHDFVESSEWAAGRRPASNSTGKRRTWHECTACLEQSDETVQAPCKHHYCKTCVTQLVSDSTVDESLFPPRCCRREMPISLLRPYLTTAMTAKFEQKAIEFGTNYRTYCYSCNEFINPDGISGHRAHCTACDRETCMLCKSEFHEQDCPKNASLDAVLQLAQETGWQRCNGCQTMIERREGCNHIT